MKYTRQLFVWILLGAHITRAWSFEDFLPVIVRQIEQAQTFFDRQNAEQVWRARVGLSFTSGFVLGCIDAEHQAVVHATGLSAAAGLSYGLWSKNSLSERDWLDIASAYVVGTFIGRLAHKTTKYCANYLHETFNKSEARVMITQDGL